MTVAPHIVVVLDILGQTTSLRSASADLLGSGMTDAHKASFKDSLEKVLKVRRAVRGVFDEHPDGAAVRERFNATRHTMSDEHQALTEDLLTAHSNQGIRAYVVGDSVVVHAPFETKLAQLNFMLLQRLMVTTCLAFPAMLVDGIPLRGAIEVGYAAALDDGDLYGPVVAEAFGLERVAGWPRVAVGPRLLNLLDDVSARQSDGVPGELARSVAQACNRYIARGTEDCAFLDFANGDLIHEFCFGSPDAAVLHRHCLARSREFAATQAKRYSELPGDDNLKVAKKYEALKAYLAQSSTTGWRWLA